MKGCGSGGWRASAGFTGVDVAIALVVVTTMTALALPLAAHTLDVSRTRHAAAALASELRSARARAVATRRATAVVFDEIAGVWTYRTCEDGNGNGVRRAEITAGTDRCFGAAVTLGSRFRDVSILVAGSIPGPEGEAPSPDPVRFGSSNIASCSGAGGCTPGTVFVRSARGSQFAVRVGGLTGRTRLLVYEPGLARWLTE
jgi:hypothetical protein